MIVKRGGRFFSFFVEQKKWIFSNCAYLPWRQRRGFYKNAHFKQKQNFGNIKFFSNKIAVGVNFYCFHVFYSASCIRKL